MSGFVWPVRVYYEDTDCGGVVYYANYLKFLERARTERLRDLGYEQDRLRDEQGIIFAVRSLEIEYLRPARFNDLLNVSADVVAAGKASLTFDQRVARISDDELLSTATVRIACVDTLNMRPCPIPASLIEEITHVG